ncbi:MAG: YbhB/YbcL family Raf kinase inhibitor-like protein [Pseudomonadota bacterium]
MKLHSDDLIDQQSIDPRLAFGKLDPVQPMALSDNLSPHLHWTDAPEGTRSFAIVCMDPDVPSVGDDVNQEGRTLPVDLPRVDFCHWALVDVPPGITSLATGECSQGVTVGGKSNPPGPAGSRQGLNDYTGFMAGSDMAGDYFGYDGPCPPWNDERLHHYTFTVYALDVAELDLPANFNGHDVVAALGNHVLDSASLTGTYTLNRNLA